MSPEDIFSQMMGGDRQEGLYTGREYALGIRDGLNKNITTYQYLDQVGIVEVVV